MKSLSSMGSYLHKVLVDKTKFWSYMAFLGDCVWIELKVNRFFSNISHSVAESSFFPLRMTNEIIIYTIMCIFKDQKKRNSIKPH